MARPRGAIPTPRHRLASATPYRPRPLTDIPAVFATVPNKLSYWLNDTDGDCVTAEEAAAKVAASIWGTSGAPTLWIPDASVQSWAQAHGVLNGADLSQVLGWMTTDPILGSDGKAYTDGPAQSVDWTTDATLRSAIAQGPVKIGVAANQLENAVGTTNGWVLTGASTDQNEDHCVGLWGYGTLAQCCQALGVPVPSGASASSLAYLLFTWDTVGVIDQASMIAITGEAWLRVPTTPQLQPTPAPTPTPAPVPSPTPPPTPVPVPPSPITGWSGTFPTGAYGLNKHQTVTVQDGVITSVQ